MQAHYLSPSGLTRLIMTNPPVPSASNVPASSSWRWAICLVWTVLVLAMPAHVLADVTRVGDDKKKKDKAAGPTPEAVAVELRAAVGSLKRVDFLIRQEPVHGTLTGLRPHPTDNNKALITYTHNGPVEEMQDSFTYACRVEGSPISAPGTVTLVGKRFDSQLEVLYPPRFNRVFLGGETNAKVMVKNTGPAIYKSPLTWQAPWSGPSNLEVAPGQTAEFVIGFRPEKAGNYRLQMELQPGLKESIVYLYGDCIQVLTISPGRLALNYVHGTGERAGLLTIVNTRSDLTLAKFKLPARLKGPAELVLEPLAKAEVTFKLDSADVGTFQEEIIVETDLSTDKIPVLAEPTPGMMRLVSPAKGPLEFGSVKRKSKALGTVTLMNMGGKPIIAGVKSIMPFLVDEAGQALRLEPGQQRNLTVQMNTERSGKYAGILEVTGGNETLTVNMVGEVQNADTPVLTATKPKPGPVTYTEPALESKVAAAPRAEGPTLKDLSPAQQAQLKSAFNALIGTQGLPMPSSVINRYLEAPDKIELLDSTTKSITLAWPKPAVMPAGWQLDMGSSTYNKDYATFVKIWTPWTTWSVENSTDDKVVMKIEGLRPSAQYELRLFAADREAKLSEPSRAFVVQTREPWSVPTWVWRVLIIGSLSIVIYVLYKIRRGEFELEF